MGRSIGKIKGVFTKEDIEAVLGEPDWEWDTFGLTKEACDCGLEEGTIYTAG